MFHLRGGGDLLLRGLLLRADLRSRSSLSGSTLLRGLCLGEFLPTGDLADFRLLAEEDDRDRGRDLDESDVPPITLLKVSFLRI